MSDYIIYYFKMISRHIILLALCFTAALAADNSARTVVTKGLITDIKRPLPSLALLKRSQTFKLKNECEEFNLKLVGLRVDAEDKVEPVVSIITLRDVTVYRMGNSLKPIANAYIVQYCSIPI